MDRQTFLHRVFPVRNQVFRLAKALLQNTQEAEDATQEVLLKLWTKRDDLSAYRSVEALALQITKNQCLNTLKSAKRQPMYDANRLELNGGDATPYQTMEAADQTRIMEQLFADLPPQQRLVMHLRNVEGYSFEEMEAITGLQANHLRVLLHRARQHVKEGFLKISSYENP
ncbi:RNA polymerase sigma factor [Catalinimonas alkaloidigena]|nr:sigma-70 family RNA polymerase sigma factor [Catalinimonas alkaloidigena]